MRKFSASRANLACRIVVAVRSSGRPKCYILSINFPSLQLKQFSMYSHYSRNESYKPYNRLLQSGGVKIVCAQNAITLPNHERHAVLCVEFFMTFRHQHIN